MPSVHQAGPVIAFVFCFCLSNPRFAAYESSRVSSYCRNEKNMSPWCFLNIESGYQCKNGHDFEYIYIYIYDNDYRRLYQRSRHSTCYLMAKVLDIHWPDGQWPVIEQPQWWKIIATRSTPSCADDPRQSEWPVRASLLSATLPNSTQLVGANETYERYVWGVETTWETYIDHPPSWYITSGLFGTYIM